MSPLLCKEEDYKFVRQSNDIVYDNLNKSHSNIASEHGLENPNDAGFIAQEYGFFIVNGSSSTLKLGRNRSERERTLSLIEQKTKRRATGL